MLEATDELLDFQAAARLLGGRLGITPRELCGYVMDDRLFSYTSCSERIVTIHMFHEWAYIAENQKSAPDYLPTIQARCHFLKRDIEEFDPAKPSAEVIKEYLKTHRIAEEDEPGNASWPESAVPTYRWVEGRLLLRWLHDKRPDSMQYLAERVKQGDLFPFRWILDYEADPAAWLFDLPSVERVCPGIHLPSPPDNGSADVQARFGAWLYDFSWREQDLDDEIRRWERMPEPLPSEALIKKDYLAGLYRRREELWAEWWCVTEGGVEGLESEAEKLPNRPVSPPRTEGRSEFSRAMIERAKALNTPEFPPVWRSLLANPPSGFKLEKSKRRNARPQFVEVQREDKKIDWDAAKKAFKRADDAGLLPPKKPAE